MCPSASSVRSACPVMCGLPSKVNVPAMASYVLKSSGSPRKLDQEVLRVVVGFTAEPTPCECFRAYRVFGWQLTVAPGRRGGYQTAEEPEMTKDSKSTIAMM